MRTTCSLLVALALLGCIPPEPPPPPDPCGDGAREDPEACDDGNQESGDGCSGVCRVESGHNFEGTPEAQGGIKDTYTGFDLPVVIHASLNGDGSDDVYNFIGGAASSGTAYFFDIIDPEAATPGDCDITLSVEIVAPGSDPGPFVNTPGSGPCFDDGGFFLENFIEGQLRISTETDPGRPYLLVLSPIL
jgi:cysteine-rich repeat protein